MATGPSPRKPAGLLLKQASKALSGIAMSLLEEFLPSPRSEVSLANPIPHREIKPFCGADGSGGDGRCRLRDSISKRRVTGVALAGQTS